MILLLSLRRRKRHNKDEDNRKLKKKSKELKEEEGKVKKKTRFLIAEQKCDQPATHSRSEAYGQTIELECNSKSFTFLSVFAVLLFLLFIPSLLPFSPPLSFICFVFYSLTHFFSFSVFVF